MAVFFHGAPGIKNPEKKQGFAFGSILYWQEIVEFVCESRVFVDEWVNSRGLCYRASRSCGWMVEKKQWAVVQGGGTLWDYEVPVLSLLHKHTPPTKANTLWQHLLFYICLLRVSMLLTFLFSQRLVTKTF